MPILQVEPNSGMREKLAEILKPTGYDLIQVSTILEADDVLGRQEFDLIVLAGGRGTESGFQYGKKLKSLGQTVLVLSTDELSEEEITELGVHFLSKHDMNKLLEKIRQIIDAK